ncbi:tripartite tricarboxylate transporter TctB family protein [Sulfitobacter sp.]|jgi:putative tricarboxylic transport membrane protein|uniref:tripartite tricarboxylate transporter TctB family protein n=1 Tax=Sulfitobacter sp. TaxID=1903071 RepID=UPI003EF7FB38
MISKRFSLNTESITLIVLLVAAALSLIFLNALIATPKALFGQSLASISPKLFPAIVLVILALLCVATLVFFKAEESDEIVEKLTKTQLGRACVFFGIMILYGLTMAPFGFLISTAIATTLISLQMGSRSVIQIASVAIVGPVLLYLAATRLLAVSLPELNTIELFYAHLFSL